MAKNVNKQHQLADDSMFRHDNHHQITASPNTLSSL